MNAKSTRMLLITTVLLLLPTIATADRTIEIEKVPLDKDHLALQTGSELYQGFCAVCHGPAARGDGPASAALDPTPVDLTRLAVDNHGTFPTMSVMHCISGRFQPSDHHSEMPAWEAVFVAATDDPVGSRLRVRNLTLYLETIQQPAD